MVARSSTAERPQGLAEKLDDLTRLCRRDEFIRQTAQALARVSRHGCLVTVLALDLRHFNTINLDFGFGVADRILIAAAQRLRAVLDEPAVLGRMGGDEFLILLDALPDQARSDQITNRVRAAFSDPLEVPELSVQVSATIGAVHYPMTRGNAESIVLAAHDALHRAKSYQVNFWRYEDGPASQLHHPTGRALRCALHQGQFELFYQPRICLRTERIVSLEALIRWHHPERGRVQPGEFIQAAEANGMIVPLGYWILDQVNRDLQTLSDLGLPELAIASNLSFRQLQDTQFCQRLPQLLAQSGHDPARLEFELTETAVLRQPEHAMETLQNVHALGARIALDDFGTGYSSLTHIQQFPIQVIKIDRSFVQRMTQEPEALAIVGSIVRLAHELDLQVVAEGVETLDQLALLQAHSCDQVQGFLLSHPRPLWEILQLFDQTLAPLAQPIPVQPKAQARA